MSLKKSLIPVLAVAAIAVGSLTACATTSSSNIKTTTTPTSGWSFSFGGNDSKFDDLPSDIPYLTSFTDSKATGDQATGNFELALKTGSANAAKDAGKKLTAAGFTATAGSNVYASAKWKVTLEGTAGEVKYTITKNS
ncbi:hypothetical protein [Leifsonia sp. 2MCAF36]|uniref:hypothetical protein n=1 Tax=Leifsonia sp. 2MCAF36 TaxID=3232988 RepID=UPI003F9893AC